MGEIVFLCGLRDPNQSVTEMGDLHDAEEQGVLTLLRLVRAWAARAAGQAAGLRVVTNGVHALRDADRPLPWSSAILGLAKVAGREFSLLATSTLDLPTDCNDSAAACALRETGWRPNIAADNRASWRFAEDAGTRAGWLESTCLPSNSSRCGRREFI